MIPRFRAWYKGNANSCPASVKPHMIDVLSIHYDKGGYIEEKWHREEDGSWFIGYFYSFEFIDLMQSTGLKDCDGKEIFDGDIVLTSRGRIAKVFWDNQMYQYMFSYNDVYGIKNMPLYSNEFKHCFVIGNIYENEELL